ncbi:MAG TPA: hypothetical protein VMI31_10255, partial [Fimbriimonadaceae bacterium]|nr:hypothetical protein [Fimbriimonadaceae bacterium]
DSILVRTADGTTWQVDLGPDSYVGRQPISISMNDTVRVRGSKVMIGHDEVVLAQRIAKGKEILTLRSPSGHPDWNETYAEEVAPPEQPILRGTVTNVDSYVDPVTGPTDLMTIQTKEGAFQVALAPNWYAERQREMAQSAVGPWVNFVPGPFTYSPFGNVPQPSFINVPSFGWPNSGWTVYTGPTVYQGASYWRF